MIVRRAVSRLRGCDSCGMHRQSAPHVLFQYGYEAGPLGIHVRWRKGLFCSKKCHDESQTTEKAMNETASRALARCDEEIESIKREARAGNPDVEGMVLGLSDWRTEQKLIYEEFLRSKQLRVTPSGFSPLSAINGKLFDFQRDIVRWGLRKGKCAFFEDCGLGKTGQELEWSAQ